MKEIIIIVGTILVMKTIDYLKQMDNPFKKMIRKEIEQYLKEIVKDDK